MKMHAAMTVSALVIAVTAGAAAAHGSGEGTGQRDHGWNGGHGGHDMMQMMMQHHGMMDGPRGLPGMGMTDGQMPMMGVMSMMGGMPMMGGMSLAGVLDADGDGVVTTEEMRSGLEGLRTEYDSDGNGSLSLEEFEALHSALIRETMVDRFQYLDADGDGQITEAEMQAPADLIDRMQARHDRMMDREGDAPGEMMPDAERMRPGEGHMMRDGDPKTQEREGN